MMLVRIVLILLLSGCSVPAYVVRHGQGAGVVSAAQRHMQARIFDVSRDALFHASAQLLIEQGFIIDHADSGGGTLSASTQADGADARVTLLVEPADGRARLRAGFTHDGRKITDIAVYRAWFLLTDRALFDARR